MKEWQKQRLDFYNDSGALDFIKNYFDVKKGFRCIAGHEMNMYELNHQPVYRVWKDNKCRAFTLPDYITKKYTVLIAYGCVHSFIYAFNESALKWNDAINSRPLFIDNRIGLNPTIELDTPDDPTSNKARRLTFFDYIDEFNEAISIIDNLFKEIEENACNITGETCNLEYNLQFSGNGIYIHLEGCYDDNFFIEETKSSERLGEWTIRTSEIVDNFVNILDTLKYERGLGDKDKVHVCNSKAPWNDYFKIPFTFHETRPRISIPLPNEKLDSKYIDRASNTINIFNDINYSLTKEIIEKCIWKKIW